MSWGGSPDRRPSYLHQIPFLHSENTMGCQEAGFQGPPLCHVHAGHPLSLFFFKKMEQSRLSFTAEGRMPAGSELGLCSGACESSSFNISKPLSSIFKGALLKKTKWADVANVLSTRAFILARARGCTQVVYLGWPSYRAGTGEGLGTVKPRQSQSQCKGVPEWTIILWLSPAGTRPPEADRMGLRMEVGTFIHQLPSSRLPGGQGAQTP